MASLNHVSTVDIMNCPQDPQYEHVILWQADQYATAKEKRDAFYDSTIIGPAGQKVKFANVSYIRHNGGTIKLQAPMNLLKRANYLRFNNGNKYEDFTFYAFINDVRYINENTVEVDYTIDVMTTWIYGVDYMPNMCYIERQHTPSDGIGDYTLPEGLETGDYVTVDVEQLDYWDSHTINAEGPPSLRNTGFIVIATQGPNGETGGGIFNGVYTSLYVSVATSLDGATNSLESILQAYEQGATGNYDPIQAILMLPSFAASSINFNEIKVNYALKTNDVGFGPFKCYDKATGDYKTYTPKNNKLYCYPYNFITLVSPDGSSVNLRLENFHLSPSTGSTLASFGTFYAAFPIVESVCFPLRYEGDPEFYDTSGIDGGTRINTKYAVYNKTYPTCAVASDQFAAWWAQNKHSMPFLAAAVDGVGAFQNSLSGGNTPGQAFEDAVGSAISSFGASGALMAGGMGMQLFDKGLDAWITSKNPAHWLRMSPYNQDFPGFLLEQGGKAMETIGSQLATYENHKAIPDSVAGAANNGGVLHLIKQDCYKIYYNKIRPEFAGMIDNYFQCYGYRISLVQDPNITCRRDWNYIKTVGCTLQTSINLEELSLPAGIDKAICGVFDKGVTFWHDPANIHNYGLPNPIVT